MVTGSCCPAPTPGGRCCSTYGRRGVARARGNCPHLQRYSTQQGANGVQVVGIALDDPAAVRAFLQHIEVTYPIAIDAPGPADAGVRPWRSERRAAVFGADRGRWPAAGKQRIGPFADGEIEGWAGN